MCFFSKSLWKRVNIKTNVMLLLLLLLLRFRRFEDRIFVSTRFRIFNVMHFLISSNDYTYTKPYILHRRHGPRVKKSFPQNEHFIHAAQTPNFMPVTEPWEPLGFNPICIDKLSTGKNLGLRPSCSPGSRENQSNNNFPLLCRVAYSRVVPHHTSLKAITFAVVQ